MARHACVSRFFPGDDSASRLRLAQCGAGDCNSGRRTCRHRRHSHNVGWFPTLPDVARAVFGCDLPGENLGWSLPGANPSEAIRSHEGRLAAWTRCGSTDSHYRWVHPVSWRVGPLERGLPGLGSVCRAALSGLKTGNNGLRRPAEGLDEAKKIRAMASREANYSRIC